MSLPDRVRSALSHDFGFKSSGRPYRLVVEISNACNLRCTMCPRNSMVRKVEYMDLDFFESLLRDNCDWLEFVSLNGYGEPLLHPELPRMLECCRKYGVGSGVSTNCTRLDEERGEQLLRHPPDILTLAVDGIDAASYEAIRAGAQFDKVVANVQRFLRQKGPKPPFTILQCIYMPETERSVRPFKDFFRGQPYDAVRIRQLTHSGRQHGEKYVNDAGPCYWLWNEGMVLSNGVLTPCCQDVNGDLALGDLRQTSLRQLWSRGRIEQLRKVHAAGKRASIPICRDCNMYQPGKLVRHIAQIPNTTTVNTLLPRVESALSAWRYSRKGGQS